MQALVRLRWQVSGCSGCGYGFDYDSAALLLDVDSGCVRPGPGLDWLQFVLRPSFLQRIECERQVLESPSRLSVQRSKLCVWRKVTKE